MVRILAVFKNIKRPWLVGGIAAAAVFLLAIFGLIYFSPQQKLSVFNFLPPDTIFYYEQSEGSAAISAWTKDQHLLSNQFLDRQEEFLQTLLSAEYDQSGDRLWFKTATTPGANSFLLEIKEPVRPLLQRLQADNPQYFYKALRTDILLVSDQAEVVADLANTANTFWLEAVEQPGINIYWQTDKPWPMLDPLGAWLATFVDGPELFLSIYVRGDQKIINLSQPLPSAWPAGTSRPSYEQIKLPADFDLALGHDQTAADKLPFIRDTLIKPIFKNIPYDSLFVQNQLALSAGSLVLQRGGDWLLVGPHDWRSFLLDLASQLILSEKRQTLPDGTTYTELVASKDASVSEQLYHDQKYWQFDNLYGWSVDNSYYLANSQPWLERFMDQNAPLAYWWQDCTGQPSPQISDFMFWQADKVPEGQIKDYLKDKNIGFLSFFAWFNASKQGWQLCLKQ